MSNEYTFASLAAAFSYYTECNLATLERVKTIKRASKFEIGRQQQICDGMVKACRDFGVTAERVGRPRLTQILSQRT